MIDFDKSIYIIDWQSQQGVAIKRLKACTGLTVMGRSTRWDGRHATANVRTLAKVDCDHLGIEHDRPVTFTQEIK